MLSVATDYFLFDYLKQKREAPPGEKPEPVRTHLRNMIIVPEMIGSIIGVYNGKTFNQVEIKPEMIGHYLAEFSISYKPVKHGRPGIGATHSSRPRALPKCLSTPDWDLSEIPVLVYYLGGTDFCNDRRFGKINFGSLSLRLCGLCLARWYAGWLESSFSHLLIPAVPNEALATTGGEQLLHRSMLYLKSKRHPHPFERAMQVTSVAWGVHSEEETCHDFKLGEDEDNRHRLGRSHQYAEEVIGKTFHPFAMLINGSWLYKCMGTMQKCGKRCLSVSNFNRLRICIKSIAMKTRNCALEMGQGIALFHPSWRDPRH
ncbi:hypothetical protein ACLOJK_032359 [Asimina triloba]